MVPLGNQIRHKAYVYMEHLKYLLEETDEVEEDEDDLDDDDLKDDEEDDEEEEEEVPAE